MTSIQTDFDAIVVGSGISGGWAAKELTEKGLRVLVLERGKPLEHQTDYIGEHAKSWQFDHYSMPDRALYASDYAVQSHSYALNPANLHFWNNDRLNPYSQNEERPFSWKRADVVGGRSLLWGRQTYRWSAQDFEANKVDKSGIPWPVSYDDISPWYSHVEKFAGISGEAEGWDELPDSEFLPAMNYHALEKTIKSRVQKKHEHIKVTMGRCAILTKDHNGRKACHYCGPCHNGCSTGSYFSSQSSTLPAAKATGRLTLLSDQLVSRLEHDETGKKITAVNTVNTKTGALQRFSAKVVFLCASTIGSAQIMLNSSSELHPNGLSNRSGALGKYLMDHAMLGHFGIFVDDIDTSYKGERPTGLYIPRFRNVGTQDEDADFLRGYGYQANCIRGDWSTSFNSKGIGHDFKDSLFKRAPYWAWSLGGFIECLPYETNAVTLHKTKKDRFGLPMPHIEFEWGENERKLARDSQEQASRIMRAAGAVMFTIGKLDSMSVGGAGVHEMGSARMGDDPSKAVLNKYNQAHEIDNLFVTDGSFMTSASCVNPSLTYMAFTARACDAAHRMINEGSI